MAAPLARLKALGSAYINRWWVPTAVFLLWCLLASVGTVLAEWKKLACTWPVNALSVMAGLSFLGVLVSASWHFAHKRWKQGATQLLLLCFNLGVAIVSFGVLAVLLCFGGSSEDHFADNLTIPQDIELLEPVDAPGEGCGGPEDTFQKAILSALEKPGNGDPTVEAHLPSLGWLEAHATEVFRRYLACHPGWRVFREHGETYATRRWMIGPDWRFTLHGFYSRITSDPFAENRAQGYQVRVTLGLSGKPWWRGSENSTWMEEGTPQKAKLPSGNGLMESHCVVTRGRCPVEIFEQSADPERRATKAALRELEEELRPLVGNATWARAEKLLPSNATQTGQPSFKLRTNIQPGIYESEIWVNPGEPGMVYLKAFEVTHCTPLSEKSLKENSNEWVGWSENPARLFLANGVFTIYEGDWGKPYAARFEVWFEPDSGFPERKLMERNFKIEGWQR